MESLDYWRLYSELTIEQAALLTVGITPTPGFEDSLRHNENWLQEVTPLSVRATPDAKTSAQRTSEVQGYVHIRNLLIKSIEAEELQAIISYRSGENGIMDFLLEEVSLINDPSGKVFRVADLIQRRPLDTTLTRIPVAAMKDWLRQRSLAPDFFFPKQPDAEKSRTASPAYMKPDHPNYAFKLAAAVKAWIAVTGDPDAVKGKSPKKALTKWLEKNAGKCGLLLKNGDLNKQAIEEIARISNWQAAGGAPKSGGGDT